MKSVALIARILEPASARGSSIGLDAHGALAPSSRAEAGSLGGFERGTTAREQQRDADCQPTGDLQPRQLLGEERDGEERCEERLQVRDERGPRRATRSIAVNQSTFVSTSGPSTAKTSAAQTSGSRSQSCRASCGIAVSSNGMAATTSAPALMR